LFSIYVSLFYSLDISVSDKINITMVNVKIRILHTSLIKQNITFVLSFVDKNRRKTAEKFVHEKDKLLSLGAGFLMKKYLPEGEIEVKESGKPYLENGPFFNVSHSEDYVVFASDESREVGVDIEKINENKIDGIRYVLDEEENKIEDINALFQVWSNKESLVKCISYELKNIKDVKGIPLEGKRIVDEESYYTKSLIFNGYSLSLTLKGEEPFNIEIINLNSLED